ncbi:hypothetical protein HK102_009334, partial [Quaeritorhiza haematococci]
MTAVTTPERQYARFQLNYLAVFCLVALGDWLQGPYQYALYRTYGLSMKKIGYLSVTGFLSGAIFGTYVGALADRWGRKKMCLAYTILYSLSCLTKASPSFAILLLGRVFGGISTSLLHTVFEAWYISEHSSRKFPAAWMSSTFARATFANGLVAIFAGILANFTTYQMGYGPFSPFGAAIVVLVGACFVIGGSWTENYGSSGKEEGGETEEEKKKEVKAQKKEGGKQHKPLAQEPAPPSFLDGLRFVINDKRVLALGLGQSFFECSMYVFVFLWGPILESAYKSGKAGQAGQAGAQDEQLSYGLIFAAFMVAIMIGSQIFGYVVRTGSESKDKKDGTETDAVKGWLSPEQIGLFTFLLASASLAVPLFTKSGPLVLLCFCLFELCCGIYFPTWGTLRASYVPNRIRATVSNIFRIPLNVGVVLLILSG